MSGTITHKQLKRFGLTKHETRVYRIIQGRGEIGVKEISGAAKIRREAVYRLLYRLKSKGLIAQTKKYPHRFKKLPLDFGMSNLVNSFEISADKVVGIPDLFAGPFAIYPDRSQHQQVGKQLLKIVKKEALIIASGTGKHEPEFMRSRAGVVQRSAEYKVIILQYNKSNETLVRNWTKNGFIIRHYPGTGLNMVIYDRKIVQFGFRVVPESREKTGIVIRNVQLAEFLADFYDNLWKKSVNII